jgi:hypothetical protein
MKTSESNGWLKLKMGVNMGTASGMSFLVSHVNCEVIKIGYVCKHPVMNVASSSPTVTTYRLKR